MKDASVLDICHRHSTCSLLSSLCLPHFPHPLCERCFSVGHFSWTLKVFASLLPLPPPPPPPPKKKKYVKDASVLDIFRKRSRRSLLSFSPLCLTRPAPYPSACHFPLSLRSHKMYLKQGRRKRGPVRDCIACDPPKKDGQGFRRTGASYYCRELDRIACDPPKKDGQGFKRT